MVHFHFHFPEYQKKGTRSIRAVELNIIPPKVNNFDIWQRQRGNFMELVSIPIKKYYQT